MRFVYTAPRYHTNQHFPVKALLEAGHEVSFLTLTQGQSEEYAALRPTVLGYSTMYDTLCRLLGKCIGKDLVGIAEGGGIRAGGIPPVLRFWRAMRRLRPSVVIVRNPQRSAYGLLSVLIAKLIGARLIFYTQELHNRRFRGWKRLVYSFTLWATGAEWMTPVLGSPDQPEPASGRLHYVPFVMEPQTGPQEKRWFMEGAINILAIGKYQPRKNHRLLLEVAARLSNRYPIRVTIIGECSTVDHRRELENLKRRSERLGLKDKTDFKRNLSFSEMQEQYAKHDIFVLASRDEPAAFSPLEAMAHSLPVVCSDANGTKCYIRPGENGFVFRSDDRNDLESCLDNMARERKNFVEMGHRSYQLVVSEHAPARYVESLLDLINQRY